MTLVFFAYSGVAAARTRREALLTLNGYKNVSCSGALAYPEQETLYELAQETAFLL